MNAPSMPNEAVATGMHADQRSTPAAPQAADRAEQDCLGCKLTGLALGVGGGGYLLSRLWETPPPRGLHRLAIVGMAGAIFVLGVGRAVG